MSYGWSVGAVIAAALMLGGCDDSSDPGTGPGVQPTDVLQAWAT